MEYPVTVLCNNIHIDVDDATGRTVAVLRLGNGAIVRIPAEYVISMPADKKRGGNGSAMQASPLWCVEPGIFGAPAAQYTICA